MATDGSWRQRPEWPLPWPVLPSSASPGVSLSPPWTLIIVTQTRDTPPATPPTFWYSVVALKDSNLIIFWQKCSIPSRHKKCCVSVLSQWRGPEAAALPKVTIVKSLYFEKTIEYLFMPWVKIVINDIMTSIRIEQQVGLENLQCTLGWGRHCVWNPGSLCFATSN